MAESKEAGDAAPPAALPDDFYYNPTAVGEPAPIPCELPRDIIALDASFGFDATLRNNLHYLGDADGGDLALAFCTGNCVHLIQVASGQVSYLFGHNTSGVGALTVHPNKKLFAVGEKGTDPNIIVYEYPSLRPYRILRKGTEAAYSDLDFSATGAQLASAMSARATEVDERGAAAR